MTLTEKRVAHEPRIGNNSWAILMCVNCDVKTCGNFHCFRRVPHDSYIGISTWPNKNTHPVDHIFPIGHLPNHNNQCNIFINIYCIVCSYTSIWSHALHGEGAFDGLWNSHFQPVCDWRHNPMTSPALYNGWWQPPWLVLNTKSERHRAACLGLLDVMTLARFQLNQTEFGEPSKETQGVLPRRKSINTFEGGKV